MTAECPDVSFMAGSGGLQDRTWRALRQDLEGIKTIRGLLQGRTWRTSRQDEEAFKSEHELHDRIWRASSPNMSFMTGRGGHQDNTWRVSRSDGRYNNSLKIYIELPFLPYYHPSTGCDN
ncbi:unnamed protein product [Nesidiocoris tenuis]|uniref:Uncharacterized protein n=1 Tax=Nesidiocoris tenuis TaxID=355587 RepID=A0A6H5GZM2_9HEMI|nr:unnamed protein product [Nesidiocoris tenuis]